jgi:cytochrome oxidase assembly protein ShyY1
MVRKLFTPRWILIHLGVALLVFTMVNLGFWQMNRLHQKKTFNSLVTARSEEPVQKLSNNPVPTNDEWRRVNVNGTYNAAKAVTVINRSTNGAAGYDVVVPFVTDFGATVLVNRGFVPLSTKAPSPPSGSLSIVGYLRVTQTRGALGAIDNTDPKNTEFQRFDIPLIMKHVGEAPFPMFLQLIEETPSTNQDLPQRVALPELSEGPHLSYAVQWFIFSTIALTAWVVVVRRRLRDTAIDRVAPSETSA